MARSENLSKIVAIIFVMVSILNFGNYSFLYYNIDGTPTSNPILGLIRNGRVILPVVVVSLYLFSSSNRRKLILAVRANSTLFLLGLVCIVTSIVLGHGMNSIIYSFWIFTSLLFVFLLLYSKDDFNLIDLLKLLKYGSAITVALLIFSLPSLLSNGSEASLFSSKNYYAYPLCIYFQVELSLFLLKQNNTQRLSRWLILMLILFILVLSGRRMSTLCSFLGLVAYLFYRNTLLTLVSIIVLISTFSILLNYKIAGFSLNESLTIQRFSRVLDKQQGTNGEFDSSYAERERIWKAYLKAWETSPILGLGINTYEKNLAKYYNQGAAEGLGYHNTYLHVLVESGLLGGALLLLSIIKAVVSSVFFKGGIKSKIIFFILFMPLLSINWVEANFFPGQVLFMYTFSLLAFYSAKPTSLSGLSRV